MAIQTATRRYELVREIVLAIGCRVRVCGGVDFEIF